MSPEDLAYFHQEGESASGALCTTNENGQQCEGTPEQDRFLPLAGGTRKESDTVQIVHTKYVHYHLQLF